MTGLAAVGVHYLRQPAGMAAGALAFGAVFGLIGMQVGGGFLFSFFAGAAIGGLVAWRLPFWLKQKDVRRLEAQTGGLLRVLSVRLVFEPFEPALICAALQSSKPHSALVRLAHDLQCGVPAFSALRRFGAASPSVAVKKASMQLAFAYRRGDAAGLSAVADEFSQQEAAAWQRFAGRTGFASVWFEAAGALLPLLLSAYVLVGSSFLDFTFPPALAFWTLAVIFPLLSAALVAYVWLESPEPSA